MSNLYKLTKSIYSEIDRINGESQINISIESEKYITIFNDETIICNFYDLKSYYVGVLKAIQAPQIRQILLAFKDVLGGLNIKIKECGDGFYAIVDEKYIFSLDKNLGFDGYKRVFKKPINKNETYKNLLQNDNFGLQKRIFASKKELKTELKKYYLDVNDHDSAEALCQKWLDGLEPMIDRKPEKVLEELITILKSI